MSKKGKNKKDLNRRDFLKISGGMMGLAIMSTPIVEAFRKVGADTDKQQDDPTKDTSEVNQWCMVLDLRKCEGLRLCTKACIAMHFIPKEQEWIQTLKIDLEGGGSYYMPMPCFQCENAPCVKVCPVKATYHNEEGIVLIDQTRCIGCRQCMAACPYHRRFFNWKKPELPPEAALAKYSPEFPVNVEKGTVSKCVFCPHLLKDGKLPSCVTGCPNGVIYMGELNRDLATNGQEVVKLSKFLDDNKAYRYKEELGTQPRVWYIPGAGEEVGRSPEDIDELRSLVWPEGGSR
ncbi:MAG: 4Fe-4S dicluster domain-containing protein [Actinobacteria bacterium]|nr:4Fe-4S dicluster domain-containing protein [Actinomycetota bacterium]